MRITDVVVHRLRDIPIQPPPFRDVPSSIESVALLELRTDEGTSGWSINEIGHPVLLFTVEHLGPALIGEDPTRIGHVTRKLWNYAFKEPRRLGRAFVGALSMIDVALWDLKGKALDVPVATLLGGTRDRVDVYITVGATYGSAPRYETAELVAEAERLVEMGARGLKITVGRLDVPDPRHDYLRARAIREAIGPGVHFAIDGASLMSLPAAERLCHMVEELDISFFEEPVLDNDPALLAQLRRKTRIPIAAAPNDRYSCRDLLTAEAVDIMQPNVNNDAGYSGGRDIAAMAAAFNVPIGHGNGGGPHNIALHAGVTNGEGVEYHYHRWMLYNALFEGVPQPDGGLVAAPAAPGVGLEPRSGVIERHAESLAVTGR